jgi:MFS family permease
MMRKASLGTLFLTVFIDLLGFGLVIPFLPGVARQLGAGDLAAALTGTVYSLMQFLLVPVWGRLSDRVGRRPVLLVSIAATAAGMALLGFADTLPLLFAARIFTGAATANLAVAQAYIADVTPPERRARGMGIIGMAFGLGFILGPFVGGELSRFPVMGRPGAMPAFAAAALSVVNLLFAAATLPESLPPAARRQAHGHGSERLSPFDLGSVRRALALPAVGRAVAINFLLVFWFAGMEQTFRLFTDDGFGLSAEGTGRLFGLVGLVSAVVQGGLIGRLTRRFGEARLITAGLVVLAAGFLLLAASPDARAAPLLALAIASMVIALGSGLCSPSITAYVSRHAGADVQGLTLGTVQSASALGRVLGPAAAGFLYQAIDPGAPYLAGATGMALAALLAFGLERQRR